MRNLFILVLKILLQYTKFIHVIFGAGIIKHSAFGNDKKITKEKVYFSWLIYSSTRNKHQSKHFRANFKITLVSTVGTKVADKGMERYGKVADVGKVWKRFFKRNHRGGI